MLNNDQIKPVKIGAAETMAFGERLLFCRLFRRITQTALAIALGYKRSNSVHHMEHGNCQPPIRVLVEISKNLSVDLHWLITGESRDGDVLAEAHRAFCNGLKTDNKTDSIG